MDTAKKIFVGVDEVGRGPLAGPVAIGMAVVPENFDWELHIPGVNDSKKLTEKKRETIFEIATTLKKAKKIDFTVSAISAKLIDEKGIMWAIAQAQAQAIKRLEVPEDAYFKLDGGLKVAERFVNQETIIKGDAKEPVIGLASIVAKVTRDKYMQDQAKKHEYVQYGFADHKGYGTKKHREAIAQYGFTTLHRKTYCKNIIML